MVDSDLFITDDPDLRVEVEPLQRVDHIGVFRDVIVSYLVDSVDQTWCVDYCFKVGVVETLETRGKTVGTLRNTTGTNPY